jgi:hypothetical protein
MELLIDENLLKILKPFGFAALGLGTIVGKQIIYLALTYAFNQLNEED